MVIVILTRRIVIFLLLKGERIVILTNLTEEDLNLFLALRIVLITTPEWT